MKSRATFRAQLLHRPGDFQEGTRQFLVGLGVAAIGYYVGEWMVKLL